MHHLADEVSGLPGCELTTVRHLQAIMEEARTTHTMVEGTTAMTTILVSPHLNEHLLSIEDTFPLAMRGLQALPCQVKALSARPLLLTKLHMPVSLGSDRGLKLTRDQGKAPIFW